MEKNKPFLILLESLFKKNRKMKLSFVLIAFALLNIQANASYSQSKRVTLDIENESIENILNEIESKSKFFFFYRTDEIDVSKIISIKVEKLSIKEILEMIFSDGTVSFNTIKKQIVLKKLEPPLPDKTAVQVNEVANNDKTQDRIVTGQVVDEYDTPMLGVSVIIDGTSIGTSTDFDGNYSITVPENATTLVISFVGYQTQRITLDDQDVYNVKLVPDTALLDEVVVVGYGIQRKSDVTGAIATVSLERLEDKPNTN